MGLLSFTPSLPTKTFPEFSWASKLALIDELKVSLDEGISKEEFACTATTLGGTCPDWNCCKNVPSFAKEIGDGSRTTLAASPFKKFESAQDVGAAERTCPEENCCRKVPSLANKAGACSNAESPGYVSEESEPVQEGGTPENGLDPLKSSAGARILEISSEPGRAGLAQQSIFFFWRVDYLPYLQYFPVCAAIKQYRICNSVVCSIRQSRSLKFSCIHKHVRTLLRFLLSLLCTEWTIQDLKFSSLSFGLCGFL